jgi:hypothetical protein
MAEAAIRWKLEPHAPWENLPSVDYSVHGTALRIARRCLFTVWRCLLEEEWNDTLQEFYWAAKEGMAASGATYHREGRPPPCPASRREHHLSFS